MFSTLYFDFDIVLCSLQRNESSLLLITDLNRIYNKVSTIFIDLGNWCKYAQNDL